MTGALAERDVRQHRRPPGHTGAMRGAVIPRRRSVVVGQAPTREPPSDSACAAKLPATTGSMIAETIGRPPFHICIAGQCPDLDPAAWLRCRAAHPGPSGPAPPVRPEAVCFRTDATLSPTPKRVNRFRRKSPSWAKPRPGLVPRLVTVTRLGTANRVRRKSPLRPVGARSGERSWPVGDARIRGR